MVREVVFFTGISGRRPAFYSALGKLTASELLPESIGDVSVLDPQFCEREILVALSEGKEVVIDANSLSGVLDNLPPLPHEHLCKLHMVVTRGSNQEPVVVDYFVGRALDELGRGSLL